MLLWIPVEVIEEIIDDVQDLDDVRSLRNLALTSHLFLPRSRYHLLSWHVGLDSVKKLNSFCDFLDAHPDRRLLVRSVSIFPTNMGSLSLYDIVPVRLLANLPKLSQWRIDGSKTIFHFADRWISSNIPKKLLCLGHYTQTITHLHLVCACFESFPDFVRYILAFSGLRHLRCRQVGSPIDKCEHTALVRAREHLSKSSQLSHLSVRKVTIGVVMLLLESTQHTLQELVMEEIIISGYVDEGHFDLPPLISRLSKLSSITLGGEFFQCPDMAEPKHEKGDVIQFAIEVLQALASNPNSSIAEITIHLHDRWFHRVLDYAENPSNDISQMCRTAETALLRLPRLQKIEIRHHFQRGFRTWTSVTLEQYFPTLCKRGLINTVCMRPPVQGHSDPVRAGAVSPDSRWIATSSFDIPLILWDARRGTKVHERPATRDSKASFSLAFSQDGRHLASFERKHAVVVWDVRDVAEPRLVAKLEGKFQDYVWASDGTMIAADHEHGAVHFWDPSTNQTQRRLLEGYSRDRGPTLTLSPDGRWVTLGQPSSVHEIDDIVWDTTTGRPGEAIFRKSIGPMPHYITLRRECEHVLIKEESQSNFGLCRILGIKTRDSLATLEGHGNVQSGDCFTHDDAWVLYRLVKFCCHVSHWQFTYDTLLSFRAHTSDEMPLPFQDASNDGDALEASGSIYSGIPVVSLSPNRRYLATGSPYDPTVNLWNEVDCSYVRKRFTEHYRPVNYVEFSPDGEILVSGGEDGMVCIRQLRKVCPEVFSGEA